ncbi:MAG TPA: FIST N-terminal domain-containing protein [Oculatellaceae cyanobacterium]
MKWASALAGNDFLGGRFQGQGHVKEALRECVEKISFQLEGERPDLLIAFFSPHFQSEYEFLPDFLAKDLEPRNIIGCSAGGLIGGGLEVEREKAIVITAAVMPDTELTTFHCTDDDLPDMDAGPDKWEKLVGVQNETEPAFILMPDPFSFKVDSLVQGLDFAFPRSIKIGGLASGASQPGMNALLINDKLYRDGCVGLALSGNIIVDSLVAQGCRPIGKPMTITRCKDNFLLELDGKPAVHALKEVLNGLDDRDQSLARNSLFLGVVMNEFKEEVKAGDFLIRNIIGIEPRTGALAVGEVLKVGRTVQFHLRDATTSSDDLKHLLSDYKDEQSAAPVSGALLFSCLGRGRHLYGEPNHDSNCFRQFIGDVPLGGFFCNGEIGPVGGTTFLHGYTSSFGIFREKVSATN